MSKTIVDMPKVCQMFDSAYVVRMYKNEMGSYTSEAFKLLEDNKIMDEPFEITDDFTPEQSLTRLAYKILGEII